MLKSTHKTLSREQFRKLREAKQLIDDQFDVRLSLNDTDVVTAVYDFALRSESNELFRVFTDLNSLFDKSIAAPLNEEQFILLRQARSLVEAEFGTELLLGRADTFAHLWAFALSSDNEALYDIFRYLASRSYHDGTPAEQLSGPYFRRLRESLRLNTSAAAHEQLLSLNKTLSLLKADCEGNDNIPLRGQIDWLESWQADDIGDTEIIFGALSAPEFERLRAAKERVQTEFNEMLSLHTDSSLDELYDFALRSKDTELYDLASDILSRQTTTGEIRGPQNWLTQPQFTALRQARATIHSEFDERLSLRSPTIMADLYSFALRSNSESLFDLCMDIQSLQPPLAPGGAMPAREEFLTLRRGKALVAEAFAEALDLESDQVEYELYRFAIKSDDDTLFDLYSELMALPDKRPTAAFDGLSHLLTKNEFHILRQARKIIAEEFGRHLELEADDVLDRLYAFALDSKDETLFDLHAALNDEAGDEKTDTDVTTSVPDPEVPPEATVGASAGRAGSVKHGEISIETPATKGRYLRLRGWLRRRRRWLRVFSTRFATRRQVTQTPGLGTSDTHPVKHPDSTDPKAPVAPTDELDIGVISEPDARLISAPDVEHNRELNTEPGHFASATANPTPSPQATRPGEERPALPSTNARPSLISRAAGQPLQKRPQGRDNELIKADSERENKPVAQPTVSLPPVQARTIDAAQGWYISTLDERLRLRVLNQVSLGLNGSPLLVVPENEELSAMIELADTRLVLMPQLDDIFVNDAIATQPAELQDGDHIRIAQTELRIEYASS